MEGPRRLPQLRACRGGRALNRGDGKQNKVAHVRSSSQSRAAGGSFAALLCLGRQVRRHTVQAGQATPQGGGRRLGPVNDRNLVLTLRGPARRDWVLGSEAFRQELLAAVVERVGPSHYGAQRQETGLQKAERMVREEIERLGWDEDQLRARRKGHRAKVLLARRLRQETTMSLKWIAQRLQMGTWTYVSNLLNEPPETQPQAQEVLPLCQ